MDTCRWFWIFWTKVSQATRKWCLHVLVFWTPEEFVNMIFFSFLRSSDRKIFFSLFRNWFRITGDPLIIWNKMTTLIKLLLMLFCRTSRELWAFSIWKKDCSAFRITTQMILCKMILMRKLIQGPNKNMRKI